MKPTDRRGLFQACLAEHRGIVVKVARSFAQSPADAADLQQELLLQLWLALPGFAGQSRLSTWIYRVCLIDRTALFSHSRHARLRSRIGAAAA